MYLRIIVLCSSLIFNRQMAYTFFNRIITINYDMSILFYEIEKQTKKCTPSVLYYYFSQTFSFKPKSYGFHVLEQ
jgi:hypothetical protein